MGKEGACPQTTHPVRLIDVSPCLHQSLNYIKMFTVSGHVKRAPTILQSRTGRGRQHGLCVQGHESGSSGGVDGSGRGRGEAAQRGLSQPDPPKGAYLRGWQKHSPMGANDAQGHPKVVCMRNHPTPISAGVDTVKRVNIASNFKPSQHHTRCCHGSGHGWGRRGRHTRTQRTWSA